MKFFLPLAICLLFVFSSCGKKADVIAPANTNNISATVDGANVSFNAEAAARVVTNEPGAYPYLLDITGATSTAGNNAIIVITVSSENPITTGTYISSDTNPGPVSFSGLTYQQDVAGSQIANPYITDNSGHYPTTVTITSISSTNVQGTFSGTLVYSIGGSQTETVTNGKFNMTIN